VEIVACRASRQAASVELRDKDDGVGYMTVIGNERREVKGGCARVGMLA
jgi:hypothetical protein